MIGSKMNNKKIIGVITSRDDLYKFISKIRSELNLHNTDAIFTSDCYNKMPKKIVGFFNSEEDYIQLMTYDRFVNKYNDGKMI